MKYDKDVRELAAVAMDQKSKLREMSAKNQALSQELTGRFDAHRVKNRAERDANLLIGYSSCSCL